MSFKHKNQKFTDQQIKIMEHIFKTNCKPCLSLRNSLSNLFMIPVRSIQIWFQNKRSKYKKQGIVLNVDIYQKYEMICLKLIIPNKLEQENKLHQEWDNFDFLNFLK